MDNSTLTNTTKRDRDVSDLEFHGFVATKSRKRDETIVTHSREGAIGIGARIITLNGIQTDHIEPVELEDMFRGRSQKIVPMIVVSHVSDLIFHGFEATKLNSEGRTFISASTIDSLIVGNEVYAIQGIQTATLNPASLKRLFMRRNERLIPEMVRQLYEALEILNMNLERKYHMKNIRKLFD